MLMVNNLRSYLYQPIILVKMLSFLTDLHIKCHTTDLLLLFLSVKRGNENCLLRVSV